MEVDSGRMQSERVAAHLTVHELGELRDIFSMGTEPSDVRIVCGSELRFRVDLDGCSEHGKDHAAYSHPGAGQVAGRQFH